MEPKEDISLKAELRFTWHVPSSVRSHEIVGTPTSHQKFHQHPVTRFSYTHAQSSQSKHMQFSLHPRPVSEIYKRLSGPVEPSNDKTARPPGLKWATAAVSSQNPAVEGIPNFEDTSIRLLPAFRADLLLVIPVYARPDN